MQKTANKVAGITAQNTAYLENKREKLREINILRALEDNATITISTDVRYNSISQKNTYGVGLSCCHAIATWVEWQTDRHDMT